MKNIDIKYIWDKELAISSAATLYEYELKNSNKRYVGWIFIAIMQFGVVGAIKHNVFGLLVVGTIMVVYWYSLRWPLREYFIKRTFDKSPLANKTIHLIAKEDGIYKDDMLQISYQDIYKTVQLESSVVLYYTGGTLYIPNKAFSSAKDRKEFLSILY